MKKIINLYIKQKLKIALIPYLMLFLSSTMYASYAQLSKMAGLSQINLKHIVKKIVKVESMSGKYNVKNPSTGAYGRYQILPSTAKFYAKKLHIPKDKWKEPRNQEKIFTSIMMDNIKSLRRHGYKISAFSVYATHQQGAKGFGDIMKGKRLTKNLERNLRKNLPNNLRKVKKSILRITWIRYWKRRLSIS